MQKSNEKNALLIKIMRSSVLQALTVIILSGMACARPDFAQNVLNKRITLNLKNVALKEALDNIRDKADVKFVYSSSLVPLGHQVSVQANQEKLGIILNGLLAGLKVVYTVNDQSGYIVLKKNGDLPTTNILPGDYDLFPDVQERTITGKVTSKLDGSALPGVSVIIKGTNKGTVTDMDGKYKITVPGDAGTLVFTYISFQTQEVVVWLPE